MLIYTAGPYRAKNGRTVEENIATARLAAIAVWEAGHVALCPHLNTAHFERDCTVPDAAYLAGDLDMLARCDGVLLLPYWEESVGARAERNHAEALGLPIWVWPDVPSTLGVLP